MNMEQPEELRWWDASLMHSQEEACFLLISSQVNWFWMRGKFLSKMCHRLSCFFLNIFHWWSQYLLFWKSYTIIHYNKCKEERQKQVAHLEYKHFEGLKCHEDVSLDSCILNWRGGFSLQWCVTFFLWLHLPYRTWWNSQTNWITLTWSSQVGKA